MKPRRETAMRTFCAVAILGVAGVSAAVMYWAEGEASAVIIGTVALLLAVFVTYRIRNIRLYNKIFTQGREMVACLYSCDCPAFGGDFFGYTKKGGRLNTRGHMIPLVEYSDGQKMVQAQLWGIYTDAPGSVGDNLPVLVWGEAPEKVISAEGRFKDAFLLNQLLWIVGAVGIYLLIMVFR